MNRFIVRRILQIVPQLAILLVLSFALVHLTPGQTGVLDLESADSQNITALREMLGLDRPLHEQFGDWAIRLLQFDFGVSFIDGQPVIEKILERLPPTLLLTGSALLLSLLLAVPLGIVSALRRNTPVDYGLTLFAFVGISVPAFWAAILAIIAFGVMIPVLPIQGMRTVGAPVANEFLDVAKHLILPAAILGLEGTAALTRYVRSSMIEALVEDYIRTARSKGLRERVIVLRHAMKNALLPAVTILGLRLPMLVGGAVLIEAVFAWPGIGRLGLEAVLRRDYPVVMGLVVFTGVLTIVGNLLADLAYGLLDPRIKQGA